jgi:hypothetical protein
MAWRSGVVLSDDLNSALVEADPVKSGCKSPPVAQTTLAAIFWQLSASR